MSRIWRSSSAPVTRAMVTGWSASASVVVVPRSASASRLRSRHAVTPVCSGLSQYPGGRPVLGAWRAGWSQPGYLQVTMPVCSVMAPPPGLSVMLNTNSTSFLFIIQ